ncbi:MAG: phosphatase PAP2 family protein [Acidobacteriota bacterium]
MIVNSKRQHFRDPLKIDLLAHRPKLPFHGVLTVLLSIALIPLLLWVGFFPKFDWSNYLVTYWVSLGLQSIFASSLLSLTLPGSLGGVRTLWRRYWDKKPLLIILVLAVVESVWVNGWVLTLFFLICTLATIEVVSHSLAQPGGLRKSASEIFWPASYLFLGFVLVFGYNNVIASLRFYALYDGWFNRIDAALLGGATVSEISHLALGTLDAFIFDWLEFIYFGMFAEIGAAIILLALKAGRSEALRLVGSIVTAYYLALLLYYLWPSLGPFVLCADHFKHFPRDLKAYSIQNQLLINLEGLWNRGVRMQVGMDYFIAFPCMHIAQPLIVMWYLRAYQGLVTVLVVYNSLLLLSIVLLEWHYVIDIVGGTAVAILAVMMTAGSRVPNMSENRKKQVNR